MDPNQRAHEVRKKMKGRKLPEVSFIGFVSGLYAQTLIQMGLVADPVSGKPEIDLPNAKFTIDTIEVLKEKTTGNLTEEEQSALDKMLYEMRMAYIHCSQKK